MIGYAQGRSAARQPEKQFPDSVSTSATSAGPGWMICTRPMPPRNQGRSSDESAPWSHVPWTTVRD